MMNKKIIFSPYEEHNIEQEVRLVLYDDIKSEFSHIIIIKAKETHMLDIADLDIHLQYRFKYQIKVNNKWTDHINYKPVKVEYVTEEGIKYQIFPQDSKYLIVGFQGISRTPSYNYVRSLKNVAASRLYIKDDYGYDDNTYSSYYLGHNMNFNIADKVLNLIEDKRKSQNIKKENVICIGSSKGGFAALYFAYRGKYGHAIIGGPQILLGNYLSKGKLDGHKQGSILPPILKSLTGEITKENIDWANNVLFNVIKESDHDPYVKYHVGSKEPHYFNHAIPFQNFIREQKKRNVEFNLEDYETHSELAKFFPTFLIEQVNLICK